MNLIDRMANIDRRWIFLMMGLAVGIPIIVIGLTGRTLPEKATPLAKGRGAGARWRPRRRRRMRAWRRAT